MGFGLRITDEERDRFESRFGVRLTYCYGQTEACLLIAIAPLWSDRHWPALGLPAFDRDVRIVDVHDREVPIGEVGEIVVRAEPGRTVLLEYVGDPEATASTLRGGWLHTGDNGLFDEDGYLHFVDRRKDMIKRAGENISALEVETVLTAHPAIADAAVVGVPDPVRDEAVKAFVVLAPGATLTEDAIREYCLAHLAKFKVPTEIEYRDDLPRTSIGKIAKGELRKS
jgi:crotonobetaine/carnitine-CoA ligase